MRQTLDPPTQSGASLTQQHAGLTVPWSPTTDQRRTTAEMREKRGVGAISVWKSRCLHAEPDRDPEGQSGSKGGQRSRGKRGRESTASEEQQEPAHGGRPEESGSDGQRQRRVDATWRVSHARCNACWFDPLTYLLCARSSAAVGSAGWVGRGSRVCRRVLEFGRVRGEGGLRPAPSRQSHSSGGSEAAQRERPEKATKKRARAQRHRHK